MKYTMLIVLQLQLHTSQLAVYLEYQMIPNVIHLKFNFIVIYSANLHYFQLELNSRILFLYNNM